jgi:excisionase family DNA binding protein
MNEPPPLTLSVEDAAKLLGISRGLCYEAARRGELPVIRLGRRLLISRAGLYELVGADSKGVIHEMNERCATGGAYQPENARDPVP